ncbi:MAG: hypothetical protein GJ680_02515 [Alteromonadaceae bacterium]|nr:hypothetical protein [Alteromonadaceae bacterium]
MKTKVYSLVFACLAFGSSMSMANENFQVYTELNWNEVSEDNIAGSYGFILPLSENLNINVGYKDYIKANELYDIYPIEFDYSVITAALEYDFLKAEKLTTFVGLGLESSLSDVTVTQNGITQYLLEKGDNVGTVYLGLKAPINRRIGMRAGISYVESNGIVPATESVFFGLYGTFGKLPAKDKARSRAAFRGKSEPKPYAKPPGVSKVVASNQAKPQTSPAPMNVAQRSPEPVTTPETMATPQPKMLIPNRRNETPLVCLQVGRYQQKQSMDKVAELAKKNGITLFAAKDPATNDYLLMSQQTREQKQKMADKIYLEMGIKTFTAKCQQPV